MSKSYITYFCILIAINILSISSCTTQSASNKATITIELRNGKDIKLIIPPILSHQMELEYSDFNNEIYVYNKYFVISKKDTINIEINTQAIEAPGVDCNKRKDSLTANWAMQKIKEENRFAKFFSSEIINRNNFRIICTYYDSGCNINVCVNNNIFKIDIRNCKDEKLIKEIVKSLTIE